jgi:caffeoyl-CoA O-methyltransferase
MEIISSQIEAYCEEHTSPENELLALLNRETHAKILQPRMLSGHFQGRFLSLLMNVMQPKRILEIGTYTGYSALCLAEGLHPEGQLITIDVSEEREAFVQKFIDESDKKHQIRAIVGNAIEIIPNLVGMFDVVFIDADKQNYIEYYHLVADRINQNGLMIADNILWSGKVADTKHNDKDTVLLRKFNQLIQEDNRFENVLLPIRDGLIIARKK